MGSVGVGLVLVGALLLWADTRESDGESDESEAAVDSSDEAVDEQADTDATDEAAPDTEEPDDAGRGSEDDRDHATDEPLPEPIPHADACAELQSGSETNFRGADLAGCVLDEDVDLRDVVFVDADLTDARIEVGGSRENLNFDGANLTGATLGFATFENTSFVGATLVGATLRNAQFVHTDFEAADVTGLRLREIAGCLDTTGMAAPMTFFDNTGLPALIDVPAECLQEDATAEPCNAVGFAMAASVYLDVEGLDDTWGDDDLDCLSNEYERNSSGSPLDQATPRSPIPDIPTQIRDGRG